MKVFLVKEVNSDKFYISNQLKLTSGVGRTYQTHLAAMMRRNECQDNADRFFSEENYEFIVEEYDLIPELSFGRMRTWLVKEINSGKFYISNQLKLTDGAGKTYQTYQGARGRRDQCQDNANRFFSEENYEFIAEEYKLVLVENN